MSSPSTDDASTASIEPTQFRSLHVNKAPAVVSWTDDRHQSHFLSSDASGSDHVLFDIHHEPESHTALFKIIANIAYKGKRNKSNIFLYIYPERIRDLSVVDNDDRASDRLGTAVYTLEFTLSRPPALVVPKGDWVLKNDAAQSTLTALEDLSKTTSFRIAFPCRALAKDRLAALCEKASLGGWKTTAEAAHISKLYGGQGGKIIENPESKAITPSNLDQAQVTDSPPSYGDLGVSPPPHPSQIRKRRRVDSDASPINQEKASLEDICKRGFAEIGRRFDCIEKSLSNLASRLERVEQLVRETDLSRENVDSSGIDDDDLNCQPHATSELLGKRIDGVEERLTGVEQKLEAGLSEVVQDVENQLYDVRHEFDNQISVRVDDEMGVAQSSLEDFVKNELHNAAYEVEEIVREKLRDALS